MATLTPMRPTSPPPPDSTAAQPPTTLADRNRADGTRALLRTGSSIVAVGAEYLLTLEATDCASGKQLGAAKARAHSKEEVFSALDQVTDKVRGQLGESSHSVQSFRVPIAEATTPSLEALKAYSIGTVMEAQGRQEEEVLPA